MFRRRLWILATVLALGCGMVLAADWWFAYPPGATGPYVGRSRCVECHQTEHKAWQGSHHDLAMAEPAAATVVGNFQNVTFDYNGITSRFTEREGHYFVSTDGPDGAVREYEVKYTFGWTPLQQYLVELEGGRLQVLPFCWDVNRKQWFHIYRDDPQPITYRDPLHWTGRLQNWNYMCAECHSTDLRKNFDLARNEYDTQFTDIDVSCEACHGPGGMHVDLAENKLFFWDRNHGYGLAQLKGPDATAELEACARCHSHKRIVHDGFHPGRRYMDHFLLSGIDDVQHVEPLYYPDGQVQGEVYELGSFEQSHMYRKGVRCTDCHDPHTAGLKREGNRLCTECHVQAKYDTPQHHHHLQGGEGSKCVECHMPTRTYMVVDPRRDHSLRMPRPDLSVKLGTPNACTGCHLKKDTSDVARDEYQDWLTARDQRRDAAADEELRRLDAWAADKVAAWYDDNHRKDEHYGEVIAAARAGVAPGGSLTPKQQRERVDEIVARLVRLAGNKEHAGPNVRASAVALLGGYPTPQAMEANVQLLKDDEPQVRARAVGNLSSFYPSEEDLFKLRRQGAPLLSDPVRAVRIEAARVVSVVPRKMLSSEEREALGAAVTEFMDGLEAVADEPGTHLNAGIVWNNLREYDRAEQAYLQGIRLDAARMLAPLRSNLALLYDRQQRKADAERLLREAVDISAKVHALEPRAATEYATACFNLALRLLDQAAADEAEQPQRSERNFQEAELYLVKALDLAAGMSNVRQTYVEVLVQLGRKDEALRLLRHNPHGELASAQLTYQLVLEHLRANRFQQALSCAELRAEFLPDDDQAQEDLRLLREKIGSARKNN